MEGLLALTAGVLYASGIYLMLRRRLAQLIIGLGLLSNGTNLLIFTAGGLTRARPPVVPEGGTVLDPFAGSGTTLMVARQLGRKSIGIELNPDYIDIIRERIGQTPLDFGAVS